MQVWKYAKFVKVQLRSFCTGCLNWYTCKKCRNSTNMTKQGGGGGQMGKNKNIMKGL